MSIQIQDIINSFESSSKNKNQKYNDFLAHVYMTFDKKISLCKSNKEMNKYKQMRVSVLRYIVSNEKEIRSKICK
jgi:hypothetical protein